MPTSMIRASRTMMDRSCLVRGRPKRAPDRAMGRISITITGMIKDSNWAARMKYTRPMATIIARNRV